MGKYLRSCKQQQPPSPAAAVEGGAMAAAVAYSYLTLRRGRRVPAAGAGGGSACRRRRRRAGGRRCAKNGASARECGEVKSASAASLRRRRCKAVDCSQGGERADPSPSPQENCVVVVVSNDIYGERRDSGEVVQHAGGEHNRVAAGRTSLSPPEAEIEAFFAAAELTERRRFVETYNYDVALDCPLQGRFQWEPVST